MTETATEAATAHEITIRRVFDAPRDQVWKAWTEPEQLTRWWGKRGWTAPLSTITMDVRPGGMFSLTNVRDEDGREMSQEMEYREVVEPQRLVFAEAADAGCPETEGAVGTVTFTERDDGRTEMVFHTVLRTSDENREATAGGLSSSFDRLAEQLAQEPTRSPTTTRGANHDL